MIAYNSSPNFWHSSRGPMMMLAPMEDVTDTAFRELVLRISEPGQLHAMFTEFTSTDGLCHEQGRISAAQRLRVSESEKALLQKHHVKLVAQIWGNNPDKFRDATKYITDHYNFDGIDINMGCPVRNVVGQGSCSALIDNEPLAAQIIAATREATHLPLSVKTRLGVKKVDTLRWITFLLQQPIDAIILHGRIQKQMSEGIADWDEIARAVKLRNAIAPHIKIIGNGDVLSIEDALSRTVRHGTDGAMIGRGIFQNPWLFNPSKTHINTTEKISTLVQHLELFRQSNERHFLVLRRFFKIYINGFDGASKLRSQLMETLSYDQVLPVLDQFCKQHPAPSKMV
jgi:tRNA-dihydrouridine synthase